MDLAQGHAAQPVHRPHHVRRVHARGGCRFVMHPHRRSRTPGISCEAVPASMPLAGAGMRRHVHAGNHAAESFVSFIPLLGGPAHRGAITFARWSNMNRNASRYVAAV
jgi:hypothetical protein